MINPFDTDVFNMTSLTASINLLPNTYGKLEAMNLFPLFNLRQSVFYSAQRSQEISCPAQSVQRDGLCAILVLSKKRDTIQGEQDAESTLQKLAVDRGCPPL